VYKEEEDKEVLLHLRLLLFVSYCQAKREEGISNSQTVKILWLFLSSSETKTKFNI
jgi:hypothetical protein